MSEAGRPEGMHPMATEHLPVFITAPGGSDTLLVVTGIFLILAIVLVGVLYFRLHALPEHMAHRGQKVQFEIVAVLALLALFTHNHLFWIAGLLLALVPIPDFTTPLTSMAQSLGRMAGRTETRPAERPVEPEAEPAGPAPVPLDDQRPREARRS
jgi:hypothetical protein